MAKKKLFGICRICGEYAKLSFEHIPPRKAFNDNRVTFETIQDSLSNRSKTSQKGMGDYSLCESCNNNTGSWYGAAFVKWTQQGFEWFSKIGGASELNLPFRLMPLNVLKQILVMMLAMSTAERLNHLEEIRRFVLNKEQKHLPPYLRIYTYFNLSSKPRFSSGVAVTRIDLGETVFVDAEVALPPFGYVVVSSFKPKSRMLPDMLDLYDITWFSEFDYNIWTSVFLRLPAKETHEAFPLDYRTKTEVEEHYRQNNILR